MIKLSLFLLTLCIDSITQSCIRQSYSFGPFSKQIVRPKPSESKKCASSDWLHNFIKNYILDGLHLLNILVVHSQLAKLIMINII